MAKTATKKTLAPAPAAVVMSDLPRIGGILAGGKFAGILRGEGKDAPDVALVDLGEAPKQLSWKDGMAWARDQGGDMPSRDEARLLYINLRDDFKRDWYWTNAQYAGYKAYAWCQHFDYGYQYYYRKADELRARAVRRLPIQ